MPSLQENSPNVVYECLEHGIPFIASNVGGVPELIAPGGSRPRLFEPTAGASKPRSGVCCEGRVPVRRPASTVTSRSTAGPRCSGCSRSNGGVEIDATPSPSTSSSCTAGRSEALLRCVAALENRPMQHFDVVVADTRQSGLDQGSAPYVIFLKRRTSPIPDC